LIQKVLRFISVFVKSLGSGDGIECMSEKTTYLKVEAL
jgi:hypothetical protein